jgi:hypothetical protein
MSPLEGVFAAIALWALLVALSVAFDPQANRDGGMFTVMLILSLVCIAALAMAGLLP